MKPIGLTCLAAGTIAAITFFYYKEKAQPSPVLTVHTDAKDAANAKKSNSYLALIRNSNTVPYTQNGNNVADINHQDLPITNSAEEKSALPESISVNETAKSESSFTDDFLPRTFNLSYKHVAFKKAINMSKLTRKMNSLNGSIGLRNLLPGIDTTKLFYVKKASGIIENTATENSPFSERKNANPVKEKTQSEPETKETVTTEPVAASIAENTAPVKEYAHNNSAGSEIKPEKEIPKNSGSMNTVSFASAKQLDKGADGYSYSALLEETQELKDYAEQNGYNTDFAFIANLGIKQGKKRFFVVDLSSMTILKNGIVAQGKGDSSYTFDRKYSNEIGSSASSLGVYKIGKPDKNNNNACRLYGLQESNSNAYKRALTLQASEIIPYDENNYSVLNTDGSLSLSARFLKEISPMLDQTVKPVLLWIYDPTAQSQSLYSSIQKKP